MGRPKKWYLEKMDEDVGVILKSGSEAFLKPRSTTPLGAITKVSEAPEALRGRLDADVAILVCFNHSSNNDEL